MAIYNHKPSVNDANNTHLGWTGANSKMQLFGGPAASSHGRRNRRQFVEISYRARVRKHMLPNIIKLIV
jgi:hypothetical protein